MLHFMRLRLHFATSIYLPLGYLLHTPFKIIMVVVQNLLKMQVFATNAWFSFTSLSSALFPSLFSLSHSVSICCFRFCLLSTSQRECRSGAFPTLSSCLQCMFSLVAFTDCLSRCCAINNITNDMNDNVGRAVLLLCALQKSSCHSTFPSFCSLLLYNTFSWRHSFIKCLCRSIVKWLRSK